MGTLKKRFYNATAPQDRLIQRLHDIATVKGLTPEAVRIFRQIVYGYYHKNPRDLPWRKTRSAYRIMVSEVMLQQTQVERVFDKYKLFVKMFPDFSSLAEAPLKEVLGVWQGLGYNRRAIALKKIAEIVTRTYNNRLPDAQEDLLKLPGIGRYSAAAITTFAFNKKTVFIETNIRRVFIHFFFNNKSSVSDAELLPLIEKTLDAANPRDWYYALMDYGVFLGKTLKNPNRRSAHYQKQAPFQGSNRQLRGKIIQTFINHQRMTGYSLAKRLKQDPSSVNENLEQLLKEGFLKKEGRWFSVA